MSSEQMVGKGVKVLEGLFAGLRGRVVDRHDARVVYVLVDHPSNPHIPAQPMAVDNLQEV